MPAWPFAIRRSALFQFDRGLFGQRDLNGLRLQGHNHVLGCNPYLVAAATAIEVDQRQIEKYFFDINRHLLLGAEWT